MLKKHIRYLIVLTLVLVFAVLCMGALDAKKPAKVVKIALEEGRMANVGRFVATEYAKVNPEVQVEIVGLPDTNMYDKLLIALTSNSYVYDGIEFVPGWGAGFVKSGWLMPLDKYWKVNDPYFTDFVMVNTLCKFSGAPKKFAGTYYGLPFNTDVKMLLYRKDLYEQNGLKPPKSWDEFVNNCLKLQKPEQSLYGYGYPAMETDAGDAYTAFLIHIWANGGSIFDKDLKPTFNTPVNLKAFTELVEKIPLIAHPGMFETDYNEENELFASGKVVHIIQWMPAAMSVLADPKSSKVVGKIGYAPVYGVSTRGTGWAVGVTTTSRNPKETFEFLKFLCSKEMCRESLLRFSNSLVRKSLINDKALNEQLPWVSATVEALTNAQDFPPIPEKTACTRIITQELLRALKHQCTPQEALQNMDQRIYEVLQKAGYYK